MAPPSCIRPKSAACAELLCLQSVTRSAVADAEWNLCWRSLPATHRCVQKRNSTHSFIKLVIALGKELLLITTLLHNVHWCRCR